MNQIVDMTFDGAELRLDTTLPLEPNTRVRLTLEVLPPLVPSFLRTARALVLNGPPDWSANLDNYLYGEGDQSRR